MFSASQRRPGVPARRGRIDAERPQPFRYWNNDIRCTIEYDFSAAS
jgi:hypothetical protein